MPRTPAAVLWCLFFPLALAAVAQESAPSSDTLTLAGVTSTTLEVRSGRFRVALTDQGWLEWKLDSQPAALRTRILSGDSFDLLANTRLRRVETARDDTGIRARIESSASWADFAMLLTFHRTPQGLVEWEVVAEVKADRQLEATDPDIELCSPNEWKNLTGPGPNWTNYAYLHNPKARLTLLYLQDVSDLGPFCESVQVPPRSLVRVESNAIGLKLPKARAPLCQGSRLVISHGFLCLEPTSASSDLTILSDYLRLLAKIYPRIRRPDTVRTDWLDVARREAADLLRPECLTDPVQGYRHMRAYVNHFDLQYTDLHCDLEILLPISRLNRVMPSAAGKELESLLSSGLGTYLDRVNGRVYNNVVPVSFAGKQRPIWGVDQVDTWYEANNYWMLGKLALEGSSTAKEMVLAAADEWIALAQGVDYDFPLFADYRTRQGTFSHAYNVLGGYAYTMLQCYVLSGGEARFLEEAKQACAGLGRYGFERQHETHMSAAGVAACAWLFQLTGDPGYLKLLENPLANVVRRACLCEDNNGYAQYYQNFFGIGFSGSASQVAGQESAAIWEMIREADLRVGDRLPEEAQLWMAEIHKYQMNVLRYMIPPLVDPRAVHPGPLSWPVDPTLYISLEDMREGSVPLGTMGQGIYMARGGLEFAATAYERIPPGLVLFCEYPVRDKKWSDDRTLAIRIAGTPGYYARTELTWTTESPWKSAARIQVYRTHANSGVTAVASEAVGECSIRWTAEGAATYLVTDSGRRAAPDSSVAGGQVRRTETTSLLERWRGFQPDARLRVEPSSRVFLAPGATRTVMVRLLESPGRKENTLRRRLASRLPEGWMASSLQSGDPTTTSTAFSFSLTAPQGTAPGSYQGKLWIEAGESNEVLAAQGLALRVVIPTAGVEERFNPEEPLSNLTRTLCVDLDRYPYLVMVVPRFGGQYGWTLFASDRERHIRIEQDTWRVGTFCWDLRKSTGWTGVHEFDLELRAMMNSTVSLESLAMVSEPCAPPVPRPDTKVTIGPAAKEN